MVAAVRGLQRDHGLFESGTLDPRDPAVRLLLKEAEDGVRGEFPPSVAGPGEGETQTAALPFLIPIAIAGARMAAPHVARWAAPHIARLAGSVAARTATPNAAKSILGASAAGALGQSANDAGKRAGAKHRIQTDTEDTGTPPFPGEPPIKFPTKEEYPAEERKPSVTVTPIPEQRKPEVEGYPADGPRLPDKVIYQALENDEFWREANILRRFGSPRIKDLNDRVVSWYVNRGRKSGRHFNILGGGYENKETGKYRSEFLLWPQGELKIDGRAPKNASWPDLAIEDEETGLIMLLNTYDPDSKGQPNSRERWQEIKIGINKGANMIFACPSSKFLGQLIV
jgi:hypothetical protein